MKTYWLWEIKDIIKFRVVPWITLCVILVYKPLRLINIFAADNLLLSAFRASMCRRWPRINRAISSMIIRNYLEIRKHLGFPIRHGLDHEELSIVLNRTAIIRKPVIKDDVVIRKGILIITFSETFLKYLEYCNIPSLQSQFIIVLEPSWAGYAIKEILAFSLYASKDNPIYIQAPEEYDFDLIHGLGKGLVPLKIGAGHWVYNRIFFNMHLIRQYHFIFVTNNNRVKRSHIVLKAFKKLKSAYPQLSALVVIAGHGKNPDDLKKLLDFYDFEGLEVVKGIAYDRMPFVLNKSKVLIFASLKEGSSRIISESIACGTFVLAPFENIGICRSVINKSTGEFFRYGQLLRLMKYHILGEHDHDKIATWAETNINGEVTTKNIINIIDSTTKDSDLGDFSTKFNCPEILLEGNDSNRTSVDWIKSFFR